MHWYTWILLWLVVGYVLQLVALLSETFDPRWHHDMTDAFERDEFGFIFISIVLWPIPILVQTIPQHCIRIAKKPKPLLKVKVK